MPPGDGWSGLFETAFRQSRNPMVLVDDQRRQLDANGAYLRLLGYGRQAILGRPIYRFVVDGPLASPEEWAAAMDAGRFTGEARLLCADESVVAVQWAACTEVVTGRRLVLFVALTTSRWGRHFRSPDAPEPDARTLSPRECEIVRLVALGSAGPEIADELGIANETVRTHVRNAMGKLGARSRAHLVAKALAEGVVLT
jgi:DNA-binding CsgD family transcriptional regulator